MTGQATHTRPAYFEAYAVGARAAIGIRPLPVFCEACGNQLGRRWSRCAPGYADHKIGDPTQGQILYRQSSSGGRRSGAMRVEP